MLPSIYLYLDYRQYLADIYSEKKRLVPSFSYRNFACLAGSSSPNFYQLVSSRRLNISDKQVTVLSRAIGLSNEEKKYFETIVKFDHSKSHSEKDRYLQQLLMTRNVRSIKKIEKKQYEYLSHWYNSVVRELVTSAQYPDDPAWIAERIIPRITLSKVKKSVELLQELEMIRRDEANGRWVCAHKIVSTPEQVYSTAAVRYHQDMIVLGKESLERFDASERDVRSVTVGLTREGFEVLKKRMRAFWKEILVLADTQKCTEQVAQVNLQVFPVSLYKKEKK